MTQLDYHRERYLRRKQYSHKIGFHCDKEEYEAIEALALARGVPKSTILREMVTWFLENQKSLY